ncbi:hypothetical protein K2173_007452 [Erythroxylum novogranatense]|uniref:Uncharacterized protein n=1 Tax=Erythroxylum novogranatense TaxID=1862640 RepID=A0AAV8T6A6_9ROSI|nr:hypothetical protein K2173_007452 [Erythroxylum novogranatense]
MIQPIVKTKGGDFELLFDVTEEEFEVAISLRDFHTYVEAEARGLCLKPEVKPVNEVVFSWGAKRRRSANETPVFQSPSTFAQPPPPPKPPKSDQHDEAQSPSSPFSFSRNDSVESSKLLKRTASYKKTKEELLEITENLTRRNEFLAKEIQRKKLDYEQQKLSNIFLKAKKEELSCAPIMSQEPTVVRHPALLHNQFQTHLPITMHHQVVPLVSNQTAMDSVSDFREILSMRCGNTTSFVKASSGHTVETAAEAEEEDRGPRARRIPDLNQPLTETLCDDQSYYHQMMVAAHNRRMRMQIWRKKKANKSNSFCR